MSEIRVLMAGPGGHGRWHLQNIRRLRDKGFRLVGAYDYRPELVEHDELLGDVPVEADLPGLLRSTRPDITIICTPIHAHVRLALDAIQHGSAVLLEKPPAPTLADFQELLEGVGDVPCQVGFQSLGSAAVDAVQRMIADGTIGELRGIGGAGTWIREDTYFRRSPWAGHRYLNGVAVIDGVLTNPFAHAMATALRIAGADRTGLSGVEVDLYRAHDVQSDDTSSLRMTTTDGIVITIAATLCPEVDREPRLIVHGTEGTLTLWYTQDKVTLSNADGQRTTDYGRTDLLENLADHLADPTTAPLLVPLSSMGPFMELVEAVASSPEPATIPRSAIRTEPGQGRGHRIIVPGIDQAIDRSVNELALFRELGLPWASPHAAAEPVRKP